MKYYIQRGSQEYGPYSLVDLRKYVAEGNIVPNDMARREDGSEWVPVSQVLASAGGAAQPQPPPQQQASLPGWGAPQQQPQQPQWGSPQQPAQPQWGTPQQQPWGAPQPAGQPGAGPIPPDFHWALVLMLHFVTCGLFPIVWIFIEAAFVKKVDRNSKGVLFLILSIVLTAVGDVIAIAGSANNEPAPVMLGALVILVGAGFGIAAVFNMRASLVHYYNNVEPYGLRLSGVMTFFFAVFYFQYHFSKIAQWKKTGIKS